MKKVMLTVLGAGLLAVSANAQQGSWYIGGDAGFSSRATKFDNNGTVTDGVNRTSWLVSPEIGTFLTDNIQLGVQLNIGGSTIKSNDNINSKSESMNYGGTLYGRYFMGTGAFKPFIGVNVSVIPGTTKESATGLATVQSNIMTFGANLNAGFAYALNSRVTAVGSFGALGFSSSSSSVEGSNFKTTTQQFGFENAGTLGNRFTIGIYYTFKN